MNLPASKEVMAVAHCWHLKCKRGSLTTIQGSLKSFAEGDIMFKKNPTQILMILIMLAVVFAGCSEDSDNPAETSLTGTDDYSGMDFTQPYGGLTVSDENEAFDDETLQAMVYAEDGEEYNDATADDPEVQQLEDQGTRPGDPNDPTRPRFTFLRLRWGMVSGPADSLNIPETPCDVVDWSGAIHADRGIVLVRRVIRFENPIDHLTPRLDRKTVSFVSHTACHYDGLLLEIIERPEDSDPEITEPNKLHITAGPYTGVYEVADLAGLNEVIEVGPEGNLMQLNGFTLSDIAYCPKGFLAGRFRHLTEEDEELVLGEEDPGIQVGRMAGVYMDLTGRISGFMRGGYGFDADGNRVFFAKYIGRHGGFRGLMGGTWEPAEDERNLSTFEGRWVTASGQAEGLFGGVAHGVEGHPGGFFEGRWTTICDDEAEDQVQ